jgi:hypothetical protein
MAQSVQPESSRMTFTELISLAPIPLGFSVAVVALFWKLMFWTLDR